MKYKDLQTQLGRRIKTIRKNGGLTQGQLAELLNIDSQHMSRIETGKRTPSLKLLNDISIFCNIEFCILFQDNCPLQIIKRNIADLNNMCEFNT